MEQNFVRSARKFLRIVAIVFGTLGLVTMIVVPFALRRDTMPVVPVPSPAPLPDPNALDFYVGAATQLVPPTDSTLYPQPDAPLSALQSSLKTNAPALRELRKGFAFPCVNPRPASAPAPVLYSTEFRNLARQLVIESRVLAARGDWNGALNSRLDDVLFGGDLPRGGATIQALIGIACQSVARRDADKIVPHLSAKQARAAAKRFEELYESRVSPAETLTEEKWLDLDLLAIRFSQRGWRVMLAAQRLSVSPLSAAGALFLSAPAATQNYLVNMDALIANAKLPYSASKKLALPINDPVTPITASVLERTIWGFARNDAGNALLLTALALRAYQAEHGDLPKSLNQLAPSYLAKVPIDPFGNGKPLRYVRKNAREYSLYSVGPDGRDDGGKTPKTRSGKTRRYISPEERGDMVLGVNG